MEKMSSCILIAFHPDAHEAGQDPVSERRTVKCRELSVGMTESYQAMGLGLNPEKKLLIPYDRDYKGEREMEYEGERWKVIRMGADIKIKCKGCGRIVMLERAEFEKRMKKHLGKDTAEEI